jgi:hypothetical protein
MWTTPYIILRPSTDGTAKVAHEAADLKKASYFMQYVAEPGDALFQTPLHPKVVGDAIKYFYHTVTRGKFTYSNEQWVKDFCGGKEPQIAGASPNEATTS